jgi:hypothetical protein
MEGKVTVSGGLDGGVGRFQMVRRRTNQGHDEGTWRVGGRRRIEQKNNKAWNHLVNPNHKQDEGEGMGPGERTRLD